MKPRLIIFSGAGLSAESGVPTFRDADGIWSKYDLDTVCNFLTFHENYSEAHDFYNDVRTSMNHVEPNSAHRAIADLQNAHGPDRVIVITTNVDDLLERAGCTDVMHLHGNIRTMIEVETGESRDIGYSTFDHTITQPGEYKPGVVFFGEHCPEYATLNLLIDSLTADDVWITIGSSEHVVASGSLIKLINDSATTYNVNTDIDQIHDNYGRFDHHKHMSAVKFFEDENEGPLLISTVL